MSTLLNKIRVHSKDAANALEDAHFVSDDDIKTLSRQDLTELLPGKDKLRLRREVFEMIHKENSMREVKGFIPEESFRAALSNNGVLVDYLHLLKELKSHVNHLQDFVDAHIHFLEESRKDTTPHSESGRGNHVSATDVKYSSFQNSTSFGSVHHNEMALSAPNIHLKDPTPIADTSLVSTSNRSLNDQTGGPSLGAQDSSCHDVQMGSPSGSSGNDPDESYVKVSREDVSVPCKVVVCGTTFGADQQVLDKVKANVRLSETNNNQKFTLLFCVISSRMGSDVEAALAEVKDDKPIILVLMHHTRTSTVTTSVRTWARDGKDANIVMHVDVFFHETAHGLVTCSENDYAISQLQNELLRHCLGAKVEPSGQGFFNFGGSKRTDSKSGKGNKKMGTGKKTSPSPNAYSNCYP